MKIEIEQVDDKSGFPHTRFCDGCGHNHGPLYLCPKYTDELKAEINKAQKDYIALLNDLAWLEKMPLRDANIFRMMAGLEPINPLEGKVGEADS